MKQMLVGNILPQHINREMYLDIPFLWLNYLCFYGLNIRVGTFILSRSDKASYRESDHIKFIYFYQMDGVVIWIFWIKITTFFEECISIILSSCSKKIIVDHT